MENLYTVKHGVSTLDSLTGYGNYLTFGQKEFWQLDGVGNWQTSQTNSTSTTYQVNPLNQYTSINGQLLTYDANGNCTFDGFNTLTYDYANRPVIIENSKYKVEMKYDALGRRIEKKVTEKAERSPAFGGINSIPTKVGNQMDESEDEEPDEEAKIIRFYYDGARVIEEYDEENELKRSYIYGNGIDEILMMQRGEKAYWYHENALGSITHISNDKGEVVESYKYTAYGKVTIYDGKGKERKKSRIKNRFLFTGREYDNETGLYYYRFRYYSPDLGRFLQRDPVSYLTPNLFVYARSNPVNFVDSFGLKPKPPFRLGDFTLSMNQPPYPMSKTELDKILADKTRGDEFRLNMLNDWTFGLGGDDLWTHINYFNWRSGNQEFGLFWGFFTDELTSNRLDELRLIIDWLNHSNNWEIRYGLTGGAIGNFGGQWLQYQIHGRGDDIAQNYAAYQLIGGVTLGFERIDAISGLNAAVDITIMPGYRSEAQATVSTQIDLSETAYIELYAGVGGQLLENDVLSNRLEEGIRPVGGISGSFPFFFDAEWTLRVQQTLDQLTGGLGLGWKY